MYDKNDKRRLYWLIDQYLSGKINESIFCDEFYYSYDLELDHQTLTENEEIFFRELHRIASRFSEYEEDHKLDPRAFFTVEQLKQKIIETKEKLKDQNPISGK